MSQTNPSQLEKKKKIVYQAVSFITSFLKDKEFKVMLGSSYTDVLDLC